MLLRLLREPFIHFVALGAVIFAAYTWINRNAPDSESANADNRIVIDQQELDHLISLWKLQWKREPDAGELQAIIDRHLRQEVFYREALRMNLDHNDQIIKKRLAQKMEAVAIDLGNLMQPPTDERLREYFLSHEDLFTLPQSFALQQVLFLPQEMDTVQVQAQLSSLRDGADFPESRINKLSLDNHWPLTSLSELDSAFGGDFASALANLPVGKWSGPIRSGFGWHLVYIETNQPPAMPQFAQVKDFVARQYEYESGLEAQDRVFNELLAGYQVEITAERIPGNLKPVTTTSAINTPASKPVTFAEP
ncbi:peptidyl-prolyl cis-trans isomerase [Microbulbifer bruguierae]|uniref:peptidylprolyl isomerase n=1 Tax=Microbulbifer bruguierae TaxID=3029061 RepID=A0ABY8N8G7_9GAMM|nr:peptidyl-prolyl cis-trans isomerase [Microbulbifer bruguierae]WGL15194.1 peptidyl-prolyl cis-trans isomerase [Microbulbifer bruguierae]